MAEKVPGLDYQGVQHFITDFPWSADALITEIAQQADGLLGGASGSRLILDGSDFTTKGTHSVGVSRQYNGNLGQEGQLPSRRLLLPQCGGSRLARGDEVLPPKSLV